MFVTFITVTKGAAREVFRADTHDFHEIFRLFSEGSRWDRIAFGGNTSLGRSGIALDISSDGSIVVSGHKIDPLDETMLNYVEHHQNFLTAVGSLINGDSIYVGENGNAIIIKWVGSESRLEVFGSGRDNEYMDP
jgi:hypothetical protein